MHYFKNQNHKAMTLKPTQIEHVPVKIVQNKIVVLKNKLTLNYVKGQNVDILAKV